MVEVEQFKNNPNIAGIIFTGYNGQAQGTAIAKILFGEVNPGGKTSLTWYKSLNDLPDFNDYTLRGGLERTAEPICISIKTFHMNLGMDFHIQLLITVISVLVKAASHRTIKLRLRLM